MQRHHLLAQLLVAAILLPHGEELAVGERHLALGRVAHVLDGFDKVACGAGRVGGAVGLFQQQAAVGRLTRGGASSAVRTACRSGRGRRARTAALLRDGDHGRNWRLVRDRSPRPALQGARALQLLVENLCFTKNRNDV